MKISNLEELRESLIDTMRKLEEKEIDSHEATAVAKLAQCVILAKKLDMDAEREGQSKNLTGNGTMKTKGAATPKKLGYKTIPTGGALPRKEFEERFVVKDN